MDADRWQADVASHIKGVWRQQKEDIQAALLYTSALIDHTEVKEAHA